MENYSLDRLRDFNGQNNKPIYVCILGRVFDMSSKPQFYGPGGSYGIFAGHDASRCLATMRYECHTCPCVLISLSLSAEDLDKPVADLDQAQKATLNQWSTKYTELYPVVGLCRDVTSEDQAKI